MIAASITISSCRKILLEFFMGVGFYTTCRCGGSKRALCIDVFVDGRTRVINL
jgi:hypothetical protein